MAKQYCIVPWCRQWVIEQRMIKIWITKIRIEGIFGWEWRVELPFYIMQWPMWKYNLMFLTPYSSISSHLYNPSNEKVNMETKKRKFHRTPPKKKNSKCESSFLYSDFETPFKLWPDKTVSVLCSGNPRWARSMMP